MQYSTNSNAAIVALIRACPTLIGQYRQAILQLSDRQSALQQHELSKQKREAIIRLKRLGKQEMQLQLGGVSHVGALNAEIIEIECRETETEIEQEEKLIADTRREIAVCEAEVDRIITEAGIDFGNLSDASFQELMGEEYRLKHVRWIASRTIAAQVGLPSEVVEEILQLSPAEQEIYLQLHGEIVAGFLGKSIAQPLLVNDV